jgi:hypothetical protein
VLPTLPIVIVGGGGLLLLVGLHLDLGNGLARVRVRLGAADLWLLEGQLVFLLEVLDEAAVVGPQLADSVGLSVMGLDAALQLVLGFLYASLVGVAPARKGVHDEVTDALGDALMAAGGVLHLGAHAVVGLVEEASVSVCGEFTAKGAGIWCQQWKSLPCGRWRRRLAKSRR